MRYRRIGAILIASAVLVVCVAVIGSAAGPGAEKDVKKMRGPLDMHAAWIGQIVNTLELTDAKREELKKVIDEGQAAWRKWFEANHEKVAGHTKAVQEARAAGDKTQLREAMKNKKQFMHTAPSIFRHPEPVRNALPETQRALFDSRLQEQIKRAHERMQQRLPDRRAAAHETLTT